MEKMYLGIKVYSFFGCGAVFMVLGLKVKFYFY